VTVRRPALALFLLSLVVPSRGESDRFYALASDYVEALHRAYWAGQVDVNGRRPLVSLVLAVDEQTRKLSEAQEMLLRHREEPVAPARRAVEGLLSGVELMSITCAADEADINAMNDRWELSQRLEGRREERQQALEVMAASVALFKEALVKVPAVRAGGTPGRLRLSPEEAGSLWKQLNFLFGKDLAAGPRTSPLLAAVDDLRRLLREGAPIAENSP
jgi:hypothetical protein